MTHILCPEESGDGKKPTVVSRSRTLSFRMSWNVAGESIDRIHRRYRIRRNPK